MYVMHNRNTRLLYTLVTPLVVAIIAEIAVLGPIVARITGKDVILRVRAWR